MNKKSSKFKAAQTLNEANLSYAIFPRDENEIGLISNHNFPRDYTLMKKWAEDGLRKARLPIPKSPNSTWYVKEKGKFKEVERTYASLKKYGRTRVLSSYLADGKEYYIENKLICLLEEIERLEENISSNNVKGAVYTAVHATALYMEAYIDMNYSAISLAKIKQVYARSDQAQSKKKATEKAVLEAYEKLKGDGKPSLQKRIAHKADCSEGTVSKYLKQNGLSKKSQKKFPD